MKTIYTFFLSMILFCNVNAQSTNWNWAKKGIGNGADYSYAITKDNSGNVYVAGGFRSATFILGNDTLTNSTPLYEEVFVAKFDSAGNCIWVKKGMGSDQDIAKGVSVDNNGNVFVTGYFESDTLAFDNILLINATTSFWWDYFIVKYDANGNALWAHRAGGTAHETGNSVIADNSGNAYVTGFFQNFPIAFGTITLPWVWSDDAFIVKYDSSGNVVWAQAIGCSHSENGRAITIDPFGNIILTGTFSCPSVSIGGITLTNGGGSNTTQIFIAKFDTAGNALWAKKAGGNKDDSPGGVSSDNSGNIFISGNFQSATCTFDTIVLTNANSSGSYSDMYIAKYDSSGSALWARRAGGIYTDAGTGVATNLNGDVNVIGIFYDSTITFGNTTLVNSGIENTFIVKYNDTGNVVWAKQIAGNYANGSGICTDNENNVYVTGDYSTSTLVFDSLILSYSGGSDIYLAKLDDNYFTGIPGVENSIDSGIIYPNPFTRELILKFENSTDSKSFILYDISSRVIFSEVFENSIILNTEHLQNGLYIYQVRNKDGLFKSGKVVKN